MNTNRMLAYEFFAALGILSWGAIKQGYAPWPATVIRSAVAFSLLGVVGIWSERLAAWLGAGFLLALIVQAAGGNQGQSTPLTGPQGALGKFAALPPPGYDVLSLASLSAAASQSATNVSPSAPPSTPGAPVNPDIVYDSNGNPLRVMKG